MKELFKRDVLIKLGLKPHISGFDYTIEAIKLPSNTKKMTIYKEVAQKFDTTPSRVERCIRHCKDTKEDSTLWTSYFEKSSKDMHVSEFLVYIQHIIDMESDRYGK